MVNIRATLPGQAQGPARLVIGGHYDTKLSRDFPFVGASDGASSAAFLLELARALKGRANPLPIELLFLDGEEAVNWDWDAKTHRPHLWQPPLRPAGEAGGDDEGHQGVHPRRHDWRSRSGHPARGVLDGLADRRDLERREALKRPEFLDSVTPIEDDHLEFLAAGIPSVDIIDLDYPAWHTAQDDLDHVSARSLQVVGDVLLAALPAIEARIR